MNRSIYITFFLVFFSTSNFAQINASDPSFNVGDFGHGNGANYAIQTINNQSDGKIIIGGGLTAYNASPVSFIARLDSSGVLDNSFNVSANNSVVTSLIQPDGKIIIGGSFTSVNGVTRNRIARLNMDGTLDNTFNATVNAGVRKIVIQPDGKIIIGGNFTSINGITQNSLARLNPDGTLDLSFNAPALATIMALGIQPDGKIIIGGQHDFARLNADGSLDGSFNVGTGFGGAFGSVYTCSIQADGKVIVGGDFSMYNGNSQTSIVRLNTDGTVDVSFNSTVNGGGNIRSTLIQVDGKIIIGGDFVTYNGTPQKRIARLNVDGTLDAGFNSGTGIGGGVGSAVLDLAIQQDGKINIGGNFYGYNGGVGSHLLRVSDDGILDESFNTTTGIDKFVYASLLQPDGKILIGGGFTQVNGLAENKIARLNSDGLVDPGFDTGLGANNTVRSINLQPDGKIVVAGEFTTMNATNTDHIVRLNNDGSLDPGFNAINGSDGTILASYLQPDGKIIIAGTFTLVAGISRNRIARLNPDGSLDLSFNPGTGANANVYNISLQPDGKVIIAGMFTSVNGLPRHRLARLNPDGSLDVSFINGFIAANANVWTTVVQPDGKIVIGGNFVLYNSVARNRIVRLNMDGTIDNSFNPGLGFDSHVNMLLMQPDGKFLAVGEFTTFNGVSRKGIARLNNDGSLDLSFDPGTGVTDLGYYATLGSISSILIQEDGKLVIGGDFISYNGVGRNRIARILNCNPINISTTNTNVNCNGESDGAISSVVLGGFPPYAYSWSPNGESTPTISNLLAGSYGLTITDSIGCTKSHMTLISEPLVNATSFSASACNNYNWNAQTYNNSGSFQQIFVSTNGCDSIVTLNLTILSDSVTDNQVACDSLIWIDGNTYVASTNTPTFVLQNAAGCDSVVTLNLTIINSNTGTDVQTACDSYDWIDGNTYNSSTNTPTFVLQNAVGCDSTVTLNLTITHSTVGTDVQTACDSYDWIDGNTYTSSTNTPTFVLQNTVGCDSIVTLNLTILNSNTATETQTACGSYDWLVNGQTYISSGLYIDTIPNAAGCDSIITLDLTIIPSFPLTIENSFSMPSDANNCVGEAAITLSGNAPFELDFDNGSQVITSSGYSLVNNLCAGVHDLHVTDNCGDTLSTTIVIPVDSNYVFNNPFIDSLAQDSLGVTLTNCDIYYAGIDTAYIDSIWANGNTVNVIWNIIDSNGSNFDTTSYVLNNGNGVYWLQLSVFCPNKSLGEYFTVTEAIYFNNGSVSTAGLKDIGKNLFTIYPNPTNDQVHISFSGSDAELTVCDVQGKVVLKDQIQNNETISLQNFERGVYLFDLNNSQGHRVQRVVKQ